MPEPLLNQIRQSSRSMGVKLMVVCFLAIAMTVPALFVWSLIDDRSRRADEVVKEVGDLVGGPQAFLGPVLVIPYTLPATIAKPADPGVYVVFPVHGSAAVVTRTEVRHRSLFKVPVYVADISFNASFDLADIPAQAPDGAAFDWSRAEFLIGVSDARGAHNDIRMTVGGKTLTAEPAAAFSDSVMKTRQDGEPQLTFFRCPAAGIAQPKVAFDINASLKFSGAQRLAFPAFAKTTSLAVKGDWPHPGFDGDFLPVSQTISDKGFEASWTVPFIARGVPAEGSPAVISRASHTVMGVSFVELADPYQSVTRALKYVLLFLGLVFLSYFLFEVTSGKRMHPAQYILVGMAQLIFYLLLLSIAERAGFDIAFAISACATVALISAYAGWTFGSRRYGLRALAAFSSLYALIYLLLRLEDQALLLGAICSFAAVAAVMYFTRHMDWYAAATASPPATPAAVSGPTGGAVQG